MFELDKLETFNYLFDLFSGGYIGGVATIIRSIISNCKQPHTMNRSIPPPKMIKLWIKWWMERSSQEGYKGAEHPNIFSSLHNLMTIETFLKCDINDKYNFIDCKSGVQNNRYAWISGNYKNQESCLRHWYSLNYFVCNILEDWLQQREREYYLKFKPLIQLGISSDIITIILRYKNSIVIDDATFSEFGNQIRIDTYGHVFHNFPKILNWSLKEQNYHLNYAGSINQDVANLWIEYFTNKKKFLLIDSKQQLSNQGTNLQCSMQKVIYQLINSQTVNSSTI